MNKQQLLILGFVLFIGSYAYASKVHKKRKMRNPDLKKKEKDLLRIKKLAGDTRTIRTA